MLARGAPFEPQRRDWLEAGAVAAALLVLYAASAPRTVGLEDDGLFILSSYFLGVEHPPGYPLHTLLGKLFTYLPFGSVAYRVHLLSAVLGALSCGAAWMCMRVLLEGRLAAYVAAVGLGLSRVFWSQAIIAEVYTLNTHFFFALLYLGLRLCPPGSDATADPPAGRGLALMAFLFGLSLSNHWPLMLLAGPAFAILLWPRLRELLRRLPVLVPLLALGLLPYAWLVLLSWSGLIISFYGPILSFDDFWYMISRQGYAGVDDSPSAGWLDRLRFLGYTAQVVLVQFAVLGAALGALGFWVQWRLWGRRIAAALTAAFLMPTAALVLLLGFDYDSLHKHMFHVYPLPAYGVAALWMALGFAWLAERIGLRGQRAAAAAVALLALVFAAGVRPNLLADSDWAARYAQAVLKELPKDAIVFARGESDLAPIAYFHMIEGQRPDITLYQGQGLLLGNRLFDPIHDSTATMRVRIKALIDRDATPVVFTQGHVDGYARRDRWLFSELDKADKDPKRVTVDVPESFVRFFEESVLAASDDNAWVAFVQGEYRRKYGALLAQKLRRGQAPDERTRRHLEALSKDYFGALGVAEGLFVNKKGNTAAEILLFLEKAGSAMPPDAAKDHKARFFELRGYLRLERGDRAGAIEDLETSVTVWPVTENGATQALRELYAKAGDRAALDAMWARIRR